MAGVPREKKTLMLKNVNKISHVLCPSSEATVRKKPGLDPLIDLGEAVREAGGNLETPWGWRHW